MEARHFELQHEIKNYLNRLRLKTNLTHSDEIELENHIYDGVDALCKKGLSLEEAFLVTINRIGEIEILSEEYNKVNPFFVSDKIRSYSMTGLGLMLSLGTIFLFVYELIDLYRKAFLAQTTIDTMVKSLLYFALCIAVLSVFKWGKPFSVFLQKNIANKPVLTASILFLLPFLSFIAQPGLIKFFDKNGQAENFNYKFYNITDVQYINLSFYLLILSILFLSLISFVSVMRNREEMVKSFSFKSPIVFLILFSAAICSAAVMVRYIPQTNLDLQNSIFLALVYTIGSFSIALYSNSNLRIKLVIFCLFGICLGNLLVV